MSRIKTIRKTHYYTSIFMEGNTNLPAKSINEGRPVYFSYSRNSSRKPEWEHISDCMEPLLEAFRANNIKYRLDKRDIGMGDKISDFENEIGWNSEVVVIVFSDKYFRSMHCMYEFKQIKSALEHYPQKRLMCIKSGDFNLSDVNYIRELERYWNTQKVEYEDVEYHRLREHSGTEQAAYENGFYLDDIRNLYSFFSAINYSNAQSIDFGSFLMDIVKYYANTPKPKLTPKIETKKEPKVEPREEPTPAIQTPPPPPPTPTITVNIPQMPPVYYQTPQMPPVYYQAPQMPSPQINYNTFVEAPKPKQSVIKKIIRVAWLSAWLIFFAMVLRFLIHHLAYEDSIGFFIFIALIFVVPTAFMVIFLVIRIIKVLMDKK